jgi:hypothetical protein
MTLTAELKKKIWRINIFEIWKASYLGNGHSIPATNIYSTDTRSCFLMFVAAQENISFKQR